MSEPVDYSIRGARYFFGEAARARTLETCIVEPLRRFRVPGGAVIGACGHETRTPYEIRLTRKSDDKDLGIFLTGAHSGEALIDGAGLRRPVFVDPLAPAIGTGTRSGGGGGGERRAAPLTRLNREVYVAIDLILVAWNKPEADGLFAALLKQINHWGDRDLYPARIRPLNTALQNRKTNMRTILWLAAKRYTKDGTLRDIDFPLIRARLAADGLDAHEIMF